MLDAIRGLGHDGGVRNRDEGVPDSDDPSVRV